MSTNVIAPNQPSDSDGATPLNFQITLDGTAIMKADQASAQVVFNNLSGKNFLSPPPWQSATYPEYLAMMEGELKVSFAGGVLGLVDPKGQVIESHRMGQAA